jgi:hypothetical protein
VRLVLSSLGLIGLLLSGAHTAYAAPAAPVTANAKTAELPVITPHRAIYAMSLGTVKNGSTITDASGHMLFEWRDVCDGWAIQQHMQLHFAYAGGDEQNVVSTELTWEAKDGKSYKFNIRRVTNDKETEDYRGKAVTNADGTVTVTYSVPAEKVLHLPVGTLFPSAHTELILENGIKDEKFFSRRVFDGSDEDGSSDISAFISPPRAAVQEPGLDNKLKENALVAQPAWPVHMAFFKVGDETGEPDYEMDLSLLPNGIARYMNIDYGDFSVAGNLQEVEALPAQKCQ